MTLLPIPKGVISSGRLCILSSYNNNGDGVEERLHSSVNRQSWQTLEEVSAQLSKIKFYVGYMGGKSCNLALSNDPPGTYLLRRKSKEEPDLRISFVTKKKCRRGHSHLQIKEMEDGQVGVNHNDKQLIDKSIEGRIAQMDGLEKP